MDNSEELRELTRRVRERLLFQVRSGVDSLPRRGPRRDPAPTQAAAHPVVKEGQPAPRAPRPTFDPGYDRHPDAAPFLVAAEPAPAYSGDPLGAAGLRIIRQDLGDCRRCGLEATRRNIVYGTGSPNAPLVFVGEAPGEHEDASGEPFVGNAGELLTKMIAAMGFSRSEIYICNIVKCRPPGNRKPLPAEIAACEPFLIRQLGAIAPRVIVALGTSAAQTLLRTSTSISRLRGSFHDYSGIPLMPTFHPSFLLREPDAKRQVWEDLRKVMAALDRLGVPRGSGKA